MDTLRRYARAGSSAAARSGAYARRRDWEKERTYGAERAPRQETRKERSRGPDLLGQVARTLSDDTLELGVQRTHGAEQERTYGAERAPRQETGKERSRGPDLLGQIVRTLSDDTLELGVQRTHGAERTPGDETRKLGVLEERMYGAERAPRQETGKVRSRGPDLLGQVARIPSDDTLELRVQRMHAAERTPGEETGKLGVLEERMHGAERAPGQETGKYLRRYPAHVYNHMSPKQLLRKGASSTEAQKEAPQLPSAGTLSYPQTQLTSPAVRQGWRYRALELSVREHGFKLKKVGLPLIEVQEHRLVLSKDEGSTTGSLGVLYLSWPELRDDPLLERLEELPSQLPLQELALSRPKLRFFLQDIALGPRLTLLTLQLVLHDVAVSSKKEPVELVGAKNESDGASSGRLKLSGPTHDNSNDAKVTLESAKSKSKSDGASSTEEDGASSAKEDGVSGPKEDSPKEDGAEEDSTKRMGHSKKNGPTKENSNDAKVM
ncbi:hypothetical protein FIBSPDRAFT_887049 [Athelia psychrophila]|uniref:Uncharacterized protein n=1 Tax=Athelia psychrophila TaxID=1759441 RepID=A0A166Q7Q2_9AGAM|nr:hypothetical protein FIBSPDRAFT_887049 [Fibularhizoctonia sp. CBS 109695]